MGQWGEEWGLGAGGRNKTTTKILASTILDFYVPTSVSSDMGENRSPFGKLIITIYSYSEEMLVKIWMLIFCKQVSGVIFSMVCLVSLYKKTPLLFHSNIT